MDNSTTAEFKLYNTVVGQEYALVITREFAEKHPDTMKIILRLIEVDERLDGQDRYFESIKLNRTPPPPPPGREIREWEVPK